jgi:hypothetical protein
MAAQLRACVLDNGVGRLRLADTPPGKSVSGLHSFRQTSHSQQFHHSFQIVGEHMQAHFRAHPIQSLSQEMGASHPQLDCAEGMLDSLASYAHAFGGLCPSVSAWLRGQLRAPIGSHAAARSGCTGLSLRTPGNSNSSNGATLARSRYLSSAKSDVVQPDSGMRWSWDRR